MSLLQKQKNEVGHATVGVSVGKQSEKLLEKWGQYQAVQ